MKNAITGFFMLMIIFLTGASLNVIHGRNIRKNELDSTLGATMEASMKDLLDKKANGIEVNSEDFVAEFIQNTMLKMHGDANYDVTVYTVDTDKGLLDVSVTEKFTSFYKPGKVKARKQIILEDYTYQKDESYVVTFKDGDKLVRSINVQGGTALLPEIMPTQEEYADGAWVDPKDPTKKYTAANIGDILPISDIELQYKEYEFH